MSILLIFNGLELLKNRKKLLTGAHAHAMLAPVIKEHAQMPVTQAVVLVGGLGTRLRSVVSDVPKPLAPVAGQIGRAHV